MVLILHLTFFFFVNFCFRSNLLVIGLTCVILLISRLPSTKFHIVLYLRQLP